MQPQAAGRWQVDWGDRYCTLIRQSERAPYPIFALETTPGTGWYTIRLVSSSWPRATGQDARRLAVSLQPGGAALSGNPMFGTTTRGRAFSLYGLSPEDIDAMALAGALRVAREGETLFDISVPGMDRARAALRECELTVMREWGFDTAAFAALRRPPRANLAAVVSDSDYPTESIRRNESGEVVVRFMVSSEGQVSECATVLSSGHRLLDERTCSIVQARLHALPAIGADGQPVSSPMVASLRWLLP